MRNEYSKHKGDEKRLSDKASESKDIKAKGINNNC